MTNATVQAFIDTYGGRLFCINLDNTRFIYIGYEGGVKLDDISLETIGGTDFIVLSQKDSSSGKEVPYQTFHVTDSVQWIGVVGENFEKYGIDPLKLR